MWPGPVCGVRTKGNFNLFFNILVTATQMVWNCNKITNEVIVWQHNLFLCDFIAISNYLCCSEENIRKQILQLCYQYPLIIYPRFLLYQLVVLNYGSPKLLDFRASWGLTTVYLCVFCNAQMFWSKILPKNIFWKWNLSFSSYL